MSEIISSEAFKTKYNFVRFEKVDSLAICNKKYICKSYIYYAIVSCKECGIEKKLLKSDLKKNNFPNCLNCKTSKKRQDFENFESENFKVLSYSHTCKRRQLHYNVMCKKCNKTYTTSKKSILSSKSCLDCRPVKQATVDTIYKTVYHGYYSNAIKRNYSWEITIEDLVEIVKKDCFYCNSKPTLTSYERHNKTSTPVFMNGIDRFDNNLGYHKDNLRPCCKFCNRIKSDLSFEDFKNKVDLLYTVLNERSTTIPKGSTL